MVVSEVPPVPVLPLIDLLILMSTASLLVGFVLKAINLTTRYSPTVLGFSSLDFVIITGVCLGLAVVLAARTWVKLNEPRLYAARRRSALLDMQGLEAVDEELEASRAAPEGVRAERR